MPAVTNPYFTHQNYVKNATNLVIVIKNGSGLEFGKKMAAGQGCRARLPGKASGQGCQARQPGKAARQGCWARVQYARHLRSNIITADTAGKYKLIH
jgi:hypothetical protein